MTRHAEREREIRELFKIWEGVQDILNVKLTEHVINFGLAHGLSLQEMQCLAPRNEDGSPASLAGAVIDGLLKPELNS